MSGVGRIADLVAKLEELDSPQWRESLCRQFAEKSLDLIDKDFQRASNPYGDRWTPTQQPNPVLERTGVMRSGFKIVSVASTGFTIRNDVPYAQFHQYGTQRLPVRAMVPTQAAGMPASWEREYDKVAVAFVQETMR